MPTIVLCRPLHASGMALLEARHDVTIRTLNRPSPKQLADAMPGAHAVLVGLEEVDEALLAGAPDLRVVSRFGVGYDTVDIPACTRRGVVVGVTNGGNDLSVAEHTLMLLLAVARRTIEMDASVRAGKWMLREGRPMGELAGRTILVVGYGRIGTRVARLVRRVRHERDGARSRLSGAAHRRRRLHAGDRHRRRVAGGRRADACTARWARTRAI